MMKNPVQAVAGTKSGGFWYNLYAHPGHFPDGAFGEYLFIAMGKDIPADGKMYAWTGTPDVLETRPLYVSKSKTLERMG